jgi:pimeloyl-ACP methyl ester carboxylesterase
MKNDLAFDQSYGKTPPQTANELASFRVTHPFKHTWVSGCQWEYIDAGRGSEVLLILPGLLGIGEMSFQHIGAFETDCRVIAPSYPFEITTMQQMTDGVAAILEAEGIRQAHVLGGSYGGMVAQCLVRRYHSRWCRWCCRTPGGPDPIGQLPTAGSSSCCGCYR